MEKENCVICGKETPYPKDMNIEQRDNYIEGVGQLCTDCYIDLYNKNVVIVSKHENICARI
jgi:hypothetical protein